MEAQAYFQLFNPLIFLLFAAGFLSIYASKHKTPATLWIGLSYICGAFAFLVDFFRNALPDLFGVLASNGLYTATAILFVIGISQRYGAKTPWAYLALIVSCIGGAFAYFLIFNPDMWARAFSTNIGIGVIFSLGLMSIHSRVKRPIDKIIYTVYAGMCMQLFLRPFVVKSMSSDPLTLETYTTSLFYTSLHLIVGVFSITLGMLLLISICIEIINHLHKMSVTDALTNIMNRRGFEEQSNKILQHADAKKRPVAIILADIDYFKSVNDRYGHAFGDKVIARMGDIFQQYHVDGHVAGRLGGEEFALVLVDTPLAEAKKIATDLRQTFANSMFDDIDEDIRFTVSVGVVQRQKNEHLLQSLSRADQALYRAKKTGRNKVVCETDVAVKQLNQAAQKMSSGNKSETKSENKNERRVRRGVRPPPKRA